MRLHHADAQAFSAQPGSFMILALGALLASLLAAGAHGLLVKLAGPALALLVVFALSSAVLAHTHQRDFQNAIEELNRIEQER